MHRTVRPLALTCLLGAVTSLAGCGSDSPVASPVAEGTRVGPHGGPAIPLSGAKGYAEVVLDRSGVKPGSTNGARLFVYFLDHDLKAELSPLPSEVSIKAVPPGAEPVTVNLKADPGSDKLPGDKGRFTSPPGNFDFDELRGEVSASLNGQTETVPFAFR